MTNISSARDMVYHEGVLGHSYRVYDFHLIVLIVLES